MSERIGGLTSYLQDHLAGSAAAIQLLRRCIRGHDGSEAGRELELLLPEIEEDRAVLEDVLARLGAQRSTAKEATAIGGEWLARLRHLAPVVGSRSGAITALEDLELLSLGIEGKRLLWRALAELDESRLAGIDLGKLERRARSQRDRVERRRIRAALDSHRG